MKYFTAERHNKNQFCDEKYDVDANDDWERQIVAYRARMEAITVPDSVRLFEKTCCLHDADFDTWASFNEPDKLQLVIRQRDWGDWKFICVLRYKTPHKAEVISHSGPGFYDPQDTHDYVPIWLYDEFDCVGEDTYTHNILLSNGREYKVTFTDFQFLLVPLVE